MFTNDPTLRRTLAAGAFLLLALAPLTACGTDSAGSQIGKSTTEQKFDAPLSNPKSKAFGSADALERRLEDSSAPQYGGSIPLEGGRGGECTVSQRMAERGYIPCLR